MLLNMLKEMSWHLTTMVVVIMTLHGSHAESITSFLPQGTISRISMDKTSGYIYIVTERYLYQLTSSFTYVRRVCLHVMGHVDECNSTANHALIIDKVNEQLIVCSNSNNLCTIMLYRIKRSCHLVNSNLLNIFGVD